MLVVTSIIQDNEYSDKKYCILNTVTGESLLDYDDIYGYVKLVEKYLGYLFTRIV